MAKDSQVYPNDYSTKLSGESNKDKSSVLEQTRDYVVSSTIIYAFRGLSGSIASRPFRSVKRHIICCCCKINDECVVGEGEL